MFRKYKLVPVVEQREKLNNNNNTTTVAEQQQPLFKFNKNEILSALPSRNRLNAGKILDILEGEVQLAPENFNVLYSASKVEGSPLPVLIRYLVSGDKNLTAPWDIHYFADLIKPLKIPHRLLNKRAKKALGYWRV